MTDRLAVMRHYQERTPLEHAYDARINRLKAALKTGMPADIAIAADTERSREMDPLRAQHRGAVEALEQIRAVINGGGQPTARLRTVRGLVNRSLADLGGR